MNLLTSGQLRAKSIICGKDTMQVFSAIVLNLPLEKKCYKIGLKEQQKGIKGIYDNVMFWVVMEAIKN